MDFELVWTKSAAQSFEELRAAAQASGTQKKPGKQAGLFKQVNKSIALLRENPRHPSLQSHEFHSLEHPYNAREKVYEAYAQNRTPGAYRVFWCYGPKPGQITIIAITAHP